MTYVIIGVAVLWFLWKTAYEVVICHPVRVMAQQDIVRVDRIQQDLRVTLKDGEVFYGLCVGYKVLDDLHRKWYLSNLTPVDDRRKEMILSLAAEKYLSKKWWSGESREEWSHESSEDRLVRYEAASKETVKLHLVS